MKTIIITLLFFYPMFTFGQFDQNVKLDKMEIPTSSATVLLDQNITSIETPKNVKEFGMAIINSFKQGANLPSNFAIGINPYWIFKKDISTLKYFEDDLKFSKNIIHNSSVSFAFIKNDSVQNISIGVRTNLFKIMSKVHLSKIENLGIKTDSLNKKLDKIMDKYNPDRSLIVIPKELDEYQKYIDSLSIETPIFSIDFASAYNLFFDTPEFESGKSGRFGAWLTMNYNVRLEKNNNKKYLKLYLFNRFISDKKNLDTVTNQYVNNSFYDVGGRLNFEFNKVSLGYEYINRSGNGKDYRSVGTLLYKLNDNLSLVGGFGKILKRRTIWLVCLD